MEASTRPRLPAPVRALLPLLLILPIAASSALPAALPPLAQALEGQGWGAAGAYLLVSLVPLTLYVLVALALTRWVDRRPARALGLRPSWRALAGLGTGVGLAMLVMVAVAAISEVTGLGHAVPPEVIDDVAPASAPLGAVLALVFVRAFVLQGIGEEVLFRGYALQTLSRRPVLAVLGAAVVFTIPHLASSGGQTSVAEHLLYLCLPFGFALSAGMLAVAFGSVWAAVGIHGGFHVAYQLVLGVGFAGDGPAAWVMIGLGHVIVAVVVGLLIPRRRWAQVRAEGPYGGCAQNGQPR